MVLEREHGAHAQVENRIKNFKDCGLSRLPFSDCDANQTWRSTHDSTPCPHRSSADLDGTAGV